MAMSDYSLSDVAAVTGGGGFGGNGWGNDGFWILVLLLFFGGNRGWGNNGGGYAGGDQLYPWLNQAQLTTQGFADQNAVMALNGIQSSISNGFGNVATQLCNGFAGVEIGANNRQTANMQQMFGLSQQFADCCCENRLGLANLNATILAENCADRAALSDGVRDILVNQTANTQRVLDKLCSLELEEAKRETAAERRENDQLRQQLAAASLNASQIAQTGQIVDNIYNRLATCPVGTQPVYGNQPIFTCNSCGCAA